MNHSMEFIVESEVLGKNKKQTQKTIFEAQDVVLDKYDIRGMKLGAVRVPFKSFVRNFGIILARALHGSSGWTRGVVSASGASIASPAVFTATEGAVTTKRTLSGIFLGDNGLNTVNAASVGTTKSYADGKSFIEGFSRSTVGKSDYFLGRRIENQTTTASAKSGIDYGANSVTVVSGNILKIKRRFFQYRSSLNVKVAEFGLGTYSGTGGLAGSVLVARDAFSTAVDLGYEQYLDVTYSFTLPSDNQLNTNFINMLANLFSNANAYSVIQTDGITNTTPAFHTSIDFKAAADAEYGIVAGFDDNFVSPYLGSFKLENMITNATLDKGAVTFIDEIDLSSATTRFGFYRDFTNVTSNQVSINEAGLYIFKTPNYIMIARSLFNTMTLDENDVLRIKTYFNFPVTSAVAPTLEA